MPVDPQIAGLLELIEAQGQPLYEATPAQARESFRAMTVGAWDADAVPRVEVTETTLPGPSGDLPARVYRPRTPGPHPSVVFFHGGGWVIGDLDTHDNQVRLLCRDAGAVVVSVDYRLAPEAPFPAAVDDAIAATAWARDHLADLGGDERLAVAGDSAGGNLAAVVAQHVRRSGAPPLAGQLLVYPGTDVLGEHASRTENATGYFLDEPTMAWFMEHYAGGLRQGGGPAAYADPRLSPLRAGDLAGLAPAVVATAEFDPLRDEGEAYAAALAEAGVAVRVRRFDGMIHGFLDMGPVSTAAQAAVDETVALFRGVLHG